MTEAEIKEKIGEIIIILGKDIADLEIGLEKQPKTAFWAKLFREKQHNAYDLASRRIEKLFSQLRQDTIKDLIKEMDKRHFYHATQQMKGDKNINPKWLGGHATAVGELKTLSKLTTLSENSKGKEG